MRSLVEAALGRPLNLDWRDVGKDANGLKSAVLSRDRSPTSPSRSIKGLRETMFLSFPVVGLAKAYDPYALVQLAEHKHMESIVEVA